MPGSLGPLETQTFKIVAARGKKSAEEVEVLATAKWRGDRAGAEWHIQFDNRPLPWYSSDDAEGDLARMHMAPGVTRRVEFLKVGSPETLYQWLAWPGPEEDPGAFQPQVVAFAAPPKPPNPGSNQLVQEYLTWKIRLDLTARDVDTKVYEMELKVTVKWGKNFGEEGESPPPDSWVEAEKLRFTAATEWLDFRELS